MALAGASADVPRLCERPFELRIKIGVGDTVVFITLQRSLIARSVDEATPPLIQAITVEACGQRKRAIRSTGRR